MSGRAEQRMECSKMRTPAAEAAPDRTREAFAAAVRFYLQSTPRQLPSRFLYDQLGSSLFDAICNLPWYGITRAELRLLKLHAGELGRRFGSGRARVVELGSGNGEKLAALLARAGIARVHAHVVDLSGTALARAEQALRGVAHVAIEVTAHQATYEEALLALPPLRPQPTLIAFLGSNIGNFDRPGAEALLRLIRGALQAGDHLLLGVDLVKPEGELLLAYDDPLGVTAAFNKNLLVRINRELDGDFELDRFAHRAGWNAAASRIEMHLVSLAAQQVRIAGADLRFGLEAGETIWTESSYKYEPDGMVRLAEKAGFFERDRWIDPEARFALMLFEAA